MPVSRFPNPSMTGDDGIVAVGGDLEVETLIDAYTHGIFPWPQEGLPMLWFSPIERGWIDLSKEIPVPTRFERKLAKWKKEGRVEVRVDTAFREVLSHCRVAPRKGQDGTWILPEMITAYEKMFQAGHAHSIETYIDGKLAGGLYGVFVNGVFSGESMFHTVPDAGKVALLALLQMLKAGGFKFVDVQMVTPIVAAFGGALITRDEYLYHLEMAQALWETGQSNIEWVKGPMSLTF